MSVPASQPQPSAARNLYSFGLTSFFNDTATTETQRYLTILRDSVRAAVLREASVAEAYRDAEAALTPRFGDWAIFKHCLPFNVQRMYDEISGTRPRIWTASRDAELWRALATQQANKPEYEIG